MLAYNFKLFFFAIFLSCFGIALNSFARCTVLSLSHVIVDAGTTFETMFFGQSMLVPDIHIAKPVGLSIVSSLLHFA